RPHARNDQCHHQRDPRPLSRPCHACRLPPDRFRELLMTDAPHSIVLHGDSPSPRQAHRRPTVDWVKLLIPVAVLLVMAVAVYGLKGRGYWYSLKQAIGLAPAAVGAGVAQGAIPQWDRGVAAYGPVDPAL